MSIYNEKIIGLLTICRKAGKMVYGFDSVKESIVDSKAKAVLLASDISPKTAKEIRFFANKTAIDVVQTDIAIKEFEFRIGKKAGVMGICDEGYAKKFLTIVNEQNKSDE